MPVPTPVFERRPGAARLALARTLPLALAALAACAAPSSDSPSARFRLAPALRHEPRVEPIDVEHYALEISLDPARRSIQGRCRVRFVALEPLATVEFDYEGPTVDGVDDARGHALAFTHADGRLVIELAEPVGARATCEVLVRYSGVPQKGLWFVAERGGVPTQVFTQGECEDARWWFPCIDHPDERATSELSVTMPASWRATAAGERIDRVESAAGTTGERGRATERWRMTAPHPSYLETLVAGEFVVREGDWQGLPLTYLAAPEHEQRLARSFDITPDVLTFLSELTGVRYPYAKYSQACVDGFPFGGMENVSATTVTDTTLDDERGARDGTSHGLVVHEAAHQWFGDLLTCADWSQVWLNEGFATYATALYVERSEGVDAFRDQVRGLQDLYVEKDVGLERRPLVWNVWRDPMDLFFGGHTYQGGAARLHLLRFVVGEQAFFRGIRRYVGRNAGRSVRTDDLRVALEEASGKDLAWFFEQWFARPGYPEFRVRWRHDERRGRLYLAVNQVQDPADGTPEVFRTPVDVEVCDADGKRTTQRLTVDARRHVFEIECARPPRWVWFDRYGWIPKKLDTTKGAEEWLALVAGSDDVGARRDALAALANLFDLAESPEARARLVDAVAERASYDASPKVRARAVELLGGWVQLQPDLRERLLRVAAQDGEAAVRVAALDALRSVGPDATCLALAREQLEQGFSWRTMSAAVRLALVSLSDGERRELLERSMLIESPHGRLRSYLVDVLAEQDDDGAREQLLELALDRSEASLVRQAAARAVGRDAHVRPDRARLLLRLLEEDDSRLRRAVLDSFGSSRVEDTVLARGLWDYYRTTVFTRERRAIEALLAARRAP